MQARETAAPAADLVERLARSGLRGRGGGWFPAARKWHAVRIEGGDPVVVANGAEGEPGSIKDRHVMTRRPADVLAGLALAARAVGARQAYVYLKGSFEGPAAALASMLGARPPAGLDVQIRRGEDTYIAGEETAVLEVLEGRKAWPRPKPPLPSAVGLLGRPTLVQNVETLARVPAALADPGAYRARETTLVSLWGHVRRPGVYDVRLGTPLRRLIEEHGHGAPDGLGMVFPAGPSAPPLRAEAADTPLDPDALRAAGSALGTAAVLVLRGPACPVSVAASLAGFFERESCGQCPPCTLGSASLARVLRALETGEARAADLDHLAESAGFMSIHGYCAHSRTGAASVQGLLALFPDDVQAHLQARGCPRPEGRVDPFAPGSPERAAIEGLAG
ncbi:MAG TPA: NADH-ubiquinone oxidoreductase-F iron-sulfur binding region domain-containing protein [Vicinamibacteria bacterium]|nr:NADH-ubiquinone oxidoreductase-F iron-sulfur binding region domain-containing protein [Vicinamibacteria bacterium]